LAEAKAKIDASPAEIRAQVEYYMSDAALFRNCNIMGKVVGKDILLLREMAKDPEQWVPLSFLASCAKLRTTFALWRHGKDCGCCVGIAGTGAVAVRHFGASNTGGDNSAGHDWRTGARRGWPSWSRV
jgi:hypothetical protein